MLKIRSKPRISTPSWKRVIHGLASAGLAAHLSACQLVVVGANAISNPETLAPGPSSSPEISPSPDPSPSPEPGVPAAPAIDSVSEITQTGLTLSWTDHSDDESGFKILISLDDVTYVVLGTTDADTASFAVTGLDPGTLYYFRVLATNEVGDSEQSAALSVTTLSAPPPLSVSVTSPGSGVYIGTAQDSSSYAVSGTCSSTGTGGSVAVQIAGSNAPGLVSGTCDGSTWSTMINSTLLSEGSHTLVAVITQGAESASSSSVSLTRDITPPSSQSVVISGGTASTQTATVTLDLASSGATQMYITNTAGCGSGGSWEPLTATKSWTLAQTSGTGSVFAKFRDAAGNETRCTYDSIAVEIASASLASGALLLNLDPAKYNGSSFPSSGCSGSTWTDLSSSGFNGSLTNFSSCNSTSGWNGSGTPADPYRLSLDGTNDFVAVPDLAGARTAFSVSFWLNPAALASNQRVAANSSGSWGNFLFHTGGDGAVYVGTDLATRFSNAELPAGTMKTNEWQYFTYSYDGTQGRFYKNGVLLAGPKTQTAPSAWTAFQLGTSGTATLNGSIGPVQVYGRALEDSEVTQNCLFHRHQFAGATCINSPPKISPPYPTLKVNATQTFSATGGVAPYTYSIVDGDGSIDSSTGAYTALASAGSAVVRVTDAVGNTADSSVEILSSDTYVTSGLIFAVDPALANGIGFPGVDCTPSVWTNLWNVLFDGPLSNFSSCGATSGWNGSGVPSDPYRLTFDGTNDYVNFTEVKGSINTFTVGFWLNPATTTNYNLQLGSGSSWGTFRFHTGVGGVAYVGTTSTNRFAGAELGNGTISVNSWHYYTYTYDGSQGRFYKDGALLAGPKTQTAPGTWTGLNFGLANTSTLNGSLGPVQFYDRALTAPEVSENCNAFKARFQGAACY